MSKALLATIQTVAAELTLPQPSSVASPSKQSQQLVAFAQKTGIALAQDYRWPHLRKLATIPTVSGTSTYTISQVSGSSTYTCDRLICDTGWDSTNQWEFVGAINDVAWNALVYGIISTPIRKLFRAISQTQIEVFPVPSSVANLVLSFVTDCWAQSAAGVAQSTFALDADVHTFDNTVFELGVKWRFLAANGLAFADEKAEYETRAAARAGANRAPRTLSLTRRPGKRLVDYRNVPEQGYG